MKIRQLFIFIVQFVFMAVCDMIDTSFINNTGIDAICILSAYCVLEWTCYAIRGIGMYGYRVLQKNEKSCLFISVLASFIMMIVIFMIADSFPYLYLLTDTQYKLFTKILYVYAISQIPLCIGDFLRNYLILNIKNKELFISNVLFYSLMIILDAVVMFTTKTLTHFFIATLYSYIIYDIFLFIICKWGKIREEYKINIFKEIFKHGINTVFDRVTAKIATFVYNIYASKLGTELYAVHAVCYSVCVFGEAFTNGLHNYVLMNLAKCEPKYRYKETKNTLKNVWWMILLMDGAAGLILLTVIHGEVNLSMAAPYCLLYMADIISLILYEGFRANLTIAGKTDILRWGGMVAILIRIPMVLILYNIGCGLFSFALPCLFDFGARGIFYMICSKKLDRKLQNHEMPMNNIKFCSRK